MEKMEKQPPEMFYKKGVLRNFTKFTEKHKETLAQVFSCEFCEISKNNFLQNTSGRLLLKVAKADGFETCIGKMDPRS